MRKEVLNKIRKAKRALRTRKRIMADSGRVRLSVFRSNKHFYAQIIDDKKAVTLVDASEKELKELKMTKIEKAQEVGKLLAKKALAKKIDKVVFDKGSYRYHGRVKAFADAARAGGINF